jgi:hypothetical protein
VCPSQPTESIIQLDSPEDFHIISKEITNCIKKPITVKTPPINTVIAKTGISFVNHQENTSINKEPKGKIINIILSFSLIGVNKKIIPLKAKITPMLIIWI